MSKNHTLIESDGGTPKTDKSRTYTVKNSKINHNLGYIYRNPKSHWHTYFSNTHYQQIDVNILENELAYFIHLFKSQYKQKYFAIMFKIKFDNGDIRSASTVQISSTIKQDFSPLFLSLASVFKHKEYYDILSEAEEIEFFAPISGLPIGNIMFSFKPMDKIIGTKYESISRLDQNILLANDNKSKRNPLYNFKFNGYTIPSTIDLSLWPNINFMWDYRNAIASNEIKSDDRRVPLFFMINIDDFSTTTPKTRN